MGGEGLGEGEKLDGELARRAHASTADTLYNLGELQRVRGRFLGSGGAVAYAQKALAASMAALGGDHPHTADAEALLMAVLREQEEKGEGGVEEEDDEKTLAFDREGGKWGAVE